MRVLSVNVGTVAPLLIGGDQQQPPRQEASAIRKRSVSALPEAPPIQVYPLGLAGDEQADLSVHGGIDQAVYLYPAEHYPVWNTFCDQAGRRNTALPYGSLGENFTSEGLLETQLWVGDRLHIGDCIFAVTRPRQPCHKFNAHLGFNWAAKMMWQSGFTGVYLAVVKTGRIRAGDTIALHAGDRVISISELFALKARKHG
jgi:MOSC domain-containing protein YiiM